LKRLALAAIVLSLLAGALLAGAAARTLFTPANPRAGERVFEVEPGEPLVRLAERMTRAGLLTDTTPFTARLFVLWARIRGVDRQVKSGEYELSASMTPDQILARIVSGEVKTYAVTIPPGWHAREIAARLDEAGICDADALVALASDADFAHGLELPVDSLEGYLFPETYRFRRNTPPEEVATAMVEQFRSAFTDADRAAVDASEYDLHQIVTLASIVEKETGVPRERPRIASVFENRLERGMRLQSDPTVIYGILVTRGSFDGNLRRSDLETDTPYSTYTRGGIPPGPIASPGIEAIRAVLAPEDTSYLYFVSRNDGTHEFTKRLRDHNAAVARYQLGRNP
jgi:UPF0755 protein